MGRFVTALVRLIFKITTLTKRLLWHLGDREAMGDDPETEPKKNVSFEEPEKPDKSVSFVMDEEDDEEDEEEEIEMKNGGDDDQKESVGVPSKRKPGFAGPL